jgi:hypothetical protein
MTYVPDGSICVICEDPQLVSAAGMPEIGSMIFLLTACILMPILWGIFPGVKV